LTATYTCNQRIGYSKCGGQFRFIDKYATQPVSQAAEMAYTPTFNIGQP
jgi:hypothetical protein